MSSDDEKVTLTPLSTAKAYRPPMLPRRVFLGAALSAGLASASVLGWSLARQMRVVSENFSFSRGSNFAAGERERLRAFLTPALRDARMAVVIVGHSGTQGDEAANQALSQERAEAAGAIAQSMGISPAQIKVQGVGGRAPLSRRDDESARAYQARLARVEISLQRRP